MKKIIILIALLIAASNCFAESSVVIADPTGNLITPAKCGSVMYSSSAVVFSAGARISLGNTTNISQVIMSAPLGTAYIGDSSVTMATGLTLAATQSAVTLNISDLSSLYFVGPTNQRLNFIVVK